jgi:hypothetical protein
MHVPYHHCNLNLNLIGPVPGEEIFSVTSLTSSSLFPRFLTRDPFLPIPSLRSVRAGTMIAELVKLISRERQQTSLSGYCAIQILKFKFG